MLTKYVALSAGLALILMIPTAALQADTPAIKELNPIRPVSIDAQVEVLKLKNVATLSDDYDTRASIRLSGKRGKYEIQPGSDILVELSEGTRLFKFIPVGYREEAIGGSGEDFPAFHYVRLQWSLNGRVRWTMYAIPAKK